MLRKSLIVVGMCLVLIAVALAAWDPLTADRPAPPPAHTYDTRIVRDTFGVPHIFGTTDPDVAYGVAYAHAEDDFSTLQEVLAMTRGRAGAMLGADGAKVDFALHLVDARGTVTRHYAEQPADVRALLDAYAAGLNHYADTHASEVRLARLFPVTGEDVAAGFALRSPFFFGLDAVLGALADNKPLPPETAGPNPDAPDPTPLAPTGGQASDEGNRNGSNGFAVAPRRSSDGHTRLISNSHQPWRGQVAWYELVVHSKQGWDFAGANFPGAPYPLLGHNKALGWTNTVNRPDLVDIYKLTVNADRSQYRYDGKWLPLQAERVWLPVKLWGPFVLPVPKTVYRAVQGPVICNDSGCYALHYAGADNLKMVEEYYRLNRARDFAEWQRALAMQGVPATNFIYVDAAGNIGHFYNASFPNRKPGYDYRHVLPGDTSADFMPGTVPWAQVPRNVNPASGFIVNANNTPYQAAGAGSELNPADYSPLLGIETDTTNRATRALELLSANPAISADDLYRIKFDKGVSRNSWAARWFAMVLAVDPKGDKTIADAQKVLANWDWQFDGKNGADALAQFLLRAGNKWHYRRLPPSDPRADLKAAIDHLLQYFGRLDPPYGDVMRLHQGPGPHTIDLPLYCGADVLRACSSWDVAANGQLDSDHGDSFIMFVDWDQAGHVTSRSIQPFGAATTRPDSAHYADQAPLFAREQLKPVWFDPADLAKHTERSYRP